MEVQVNKEDIEFLYSPSKWNKRYSPDEVIVNHVKLLAEGSNKVKVKIPNQLNIPYGDFERQKYDIFGTDLPNGSPLFIYIHGGYWQEESITHEISSFMAKMLYQNGIKSIYIGYELCPKVSLEEIVQGICIAVSKCLAYANETAANDIIIAGHSVGAHLVASLFQSFIPKLPKEDQDKINAIFLLGGIYDITPLLITSYNEPLKLNPDSAKHLSPMFQNIIVPNKRVKFYVSVGSYDSPKYVEQSKMFHEKLIKEGISSSLSVLPDIDHFNILEKMTDPDFVINQEILHCVK